MKKATKQEMEVRTSKAAELLAVGHSATRDKFLSFTSRFKVLNCVQNCNIIALFPLNIQHAARSRIVLA